MPIRLFTVICPYSRSPSLRCIKQQRGDFPSNPTARAGQTHTAVLQLCLRFAYSPLQATSAAGGKAGAVVDPSRITIGKTAARLSCCM